MGVYDSVPPLDGGYTVGISFEVPKTRIGWGYSPVKSGGILGGNVKTPIAPVKIGTGASEYLNKLYSNIQYKKFVPKVKGIPTYKLGNGYTVSDASPPQYATHYHPNYYTKVLNKLGGEIPINYYVDDSVNFNKYLPLHGKNAQMSPDTKEFLKYLDSHFSNSVGHIQSTDWYFLQGAGYASPAQWIEEINQNYRDTILGVARSAMKAGVPCEQIYNDLVQSFPNMRGLDKTTFINACKEEKQEEIKRKKYGDAKESFDCCLAPAFAPMDYLASNESYSKYGNAGYVNYSNRLKNSTYFSDFLNTEFSVNFF